MFFLDQYLFKQDNRYSGQVMKKKKVALNLYLDPPLARYCDGLKWLWEFAEIAEVEIRKWYMCPVDSYPLLPADRCHLLVVLDTSQYLSKYGKEKKVNSFSIGKDLIYFFMENNQLFFIAEYCVFYRCNVFVFLKKKIEEWMPTFFSVEMRFMIFNLFLPIIKKKLEKMRALPPSFYMELVDKVGYWEVVFVGDENVLFWDQIRADMNMYFQENCLEVDFPTIYHRVHHHFIHSQYTLAVAESCTGGRLASHLVAIDQASVYFQGGVVSYSNAMKESVLQVKPLTLEKSRAVSEETALAMLEGILKLADSDWGISITGIAGKTDNPAEKPTGTVWIAIGNRWGLKKTFLLNREGSRAFIIEHSSVLACFYLLKCSQEYQQSG